MCVSFRGADIDCRDKDKYTPLLTASSEGHQGVVAMLLERGANLYAKNTHEKTAIFVGAEENSIDTLKVRVPLCFLFVPCLVSQGTRGVGGGSKEISEWDFQRTWWPENR